MEGPLHGSGELGFPLTMTDGWEMEAILVSVCVCCFGMIGVVGKESGEAFVLLDL